MIVAVILCAVSLYVSVVVIVGTWWVETGRHAAGLARVRAANVRTTDPRSLPPMTPITYQQTADHYAARAVEHEDHRSTLTRRDRNEHERAMARQGYPVRPPMGEPDDAKQHRLVLHYRLEAIRLGVQWTPAPDLRTEEQLAASLHAARLEQYPDLPDYLR